MRFRTFALALFISLVLIVLLPQAAHAQCYNAAGAPVACPNEKEKKKRPTPTPLPTPAPTSTNASLAVVPPVPPVGGQTGAGDGGNPAGVSPGPIGSPFLLPGILGLIIIVALIGVVLIWWRRRHALVGAGAVDPPEPDFGGNVFGKLFIEHEGFSPTAVEISPGPINIGGAGAVDPPEPDFGVNSKLGADRLPPPDADFGGGGQLGGSSSGPGGGGLGEQSSN